MLQMLPQPAPAGKDKTTWVIRALIVLLLLFLIPRLTERSPASYISAGDFVQYWASGRILLQGGNPYDENQLLVLERSAGWTESGALVPFSPPWTLLLMLPFSMLPFGLARVSWFLLNLTLLIWIADWTWRTYGGPAIYRWIAWLCPLLFMPSAIALNLGQTTPLVLGGIIGFLSALKRKRGGLAGASAVLSAMKPHTIPIFWLFFLLWILKRRRYDVLFGAVSVSLLVLLAVSIVHPRSFQLYFDVLRLGGGPLVWQTPTWGVVLRLMFPGQGIWLAFLPTVFGVALGLVIWIRRSDAFVWEPFLPIILILSSLSSAYAWTFDWVVLLPVAVLIVLGFLEFRTSCYWMALAGLVLAQIILAWQSFTRVNNLYTIWVPPVIAFLYWYAKRSIPASLAPASSNMPDRAADADAK
jgi:hypothetical protein